MGLSYKTRHVHSYPIHTGAGVLDRIQTGTPSMAKIFWEFDRARHLFFWRNRN